MRLINRKFALLFYGQAVSIVGDFVFDTTLVLWISTVLLNGDSDAPAAVSGVMISVAIATLVVGPAAGVFVDRWNQRRTMIIADAIRAVLVALLGVIALVPTRDLPTGLTLSLIYVEVFFATCAAQFFNPARFALVSAIVGEQDRARASGILQATGYTAAIAGPPLAAPVLFTLGASLAFFINACSFVLSLVMVRSLRQSLARSLRQPQGHLANEEPPERKALRRFADDLRDGIRFVFASKVLRTLVITLAVVTLGAAPLNTLNVFFVPQNLHASAHWYGTLGMGEGLGAVAGALAATRLCRRFRDVVVFGAGLIAAGLGLMCFARLGNLWAAVAVLAIIGVPLGAINTAVSPILIRATPREYLGRVISTITPVQQLATLVSAIGTGWLVSTAWRDFHHTVAGVRFGPIDTVYLTGGVAIMVGGVFATLALQHPAEQHPAEQHPTARNTT